MKSTIAFNRAKQTLVPAWWMRLRCVERTRRNACVVGFSLIELILVLGVLAMLAAWAGPSLGRFAGGRELADQAAGLKALVQYAEDQARSRGQAWRVYVDAATGRYWLMEQNQGAFSAPKSDIGKVFVMSERLRVSWVGDSAAAQRGYVQLDADGTHDQAGWLLEDQRGRQALVISDSSDESYRVVMVKE